MNQTNQIHFTVEQVTKLLQMQDTLNTYIHPDWKSQNFDWNFAIIDECREIKEHLGWKWWKENYQCGLTESNRKQVQLEVIDILHFVLSIAAQNHGRPTLYAEWFNNGNQYNNIALEQATQYLLVEAANEVSCDIYEYWNVLARLSGLTAEQVIETYTQKYVLNKFRQDHGYRTGEYQKIWKYDPESEMFKGQAVFTYIAEDNYWLEEIANSGTATDEDTLYAALEAKYDLRINK